MSSREFTKIKNMNLHNNLTHSSFWCDKWNSIMGKLRPRHTDYEQKLAILMSANALIQFMLDVVFEILHWLPTRINHLSLTLLNAFISYKTLSAVKRDRFSFMHEDCQILWLMEVCLIAGDVYYLLADEFSYKFIYLRLFFIVCSLFNWCGVSYIMCKYDLWSLSYKGHEPRLPVEDTQITRLRRSLRLNSHFDVGPDGDLHMVQMAQSVSHCTDSSESDEEKQGGEEAHVHSGDGVADLPSSSLFTTTGGGGGGGAITNQGRKNDEEDEDTIDIDRKGVSQLALI
jgi:hypothetical protein